MKQALIEVVPAAELDASVRAEILSLCSDAYEEDFSPCLDLLVGAVHVLLRIDGELFAHAAWVERALRVGGLAPPLRSAYVEAVAVSPAHQGLGHGSKVLSSLVLLLDAFDIAALSPSERPFYARLGWQLWRGPLSYRHGSETIATPDEEVMIYRLPRTPATLDLAASLSTDWRPGDVW